MRLVITSSLQNAYSVPLGPTRLAAIWQKTSSHLALMNSAELGVLNSVGSDLTFITVAVMASNTQI